LIIWKKNKDLGVDIHGDPLIQKHATMDDLVTTTAGIKRIESTGTRTTVYSNNAITRQHNHH
jgi:hypothetical protein